ncbi:hypothetical protein AMECASPLE_019525 [Ameca splendens]|uniref:Uncharacterized protein n=1 Tax=Ameca splendens TaxID=208324 RepID=A0ABV0Z2Q6_9TELE
MLLLAEDWTLSGRANAPIIRREIAAASSVFCLWNSGRPDGQLCFYLIYMFGSISTHKVHHFSSGFCSALLFGRLPFRQQQRGAEPRTICVYGCVLCNQLLGF